MIIEIKTSPWKTIFAKFEEREMKLRSKEGKLVWELAKNELKAELPYPASIWNDDMQCWVIEDTARARKVLEQIRDKYFVDKNQLTMF